MGPRRKTELENLSIDIFILVNWPVSVFPKPVSYLLKVKQINLNTKSVWYWPIFIFPDTRITLKDIEFLLINEWQLFSTTYTILINFLIIASSNLYGCRETINKTPMLEDLNAWFNRKWLIDLRTASTPPHTPLSTTHPHTYRTGLGNPVPLIVKLF